MFGGGSSDPPKAPAQQQANPEATLEKLSGQCDTIEKRIKVMENQVKDSRATALAKKKAGDIRGATMALKKMKMYEGEMTKLDGQQMMLEQQKMTIQSTMADKDVV